MRQGVSSPLWGLARCGLDTQGVALGWLGTGLWPLAGSVRNAAKHHCELTSDSIIFQ